MEQVLLDRRTLKGIGRLRPSISARFRTMSVVTWIHEFNADPAGALPRNVFRYVRRRSRRYTGVSRPASLRR
jgi:hypothetical protein